VQVKRKGDLVEGYRVLAELGKGAASAIYLVQDPRTKQVWALKHVRKEDPKDQRFLDQAEAEYEIATRLRHPGIRRIERLIKRKERFIATKDLFLVMELVDGVSLDRMENPSLEKVVDVFHQIALALCYMHDRGYVHADMKPTNVLVSEKTGAKIIDLGQSCRIGTVKPRIQGTPDYIAPEQVHRRAITPKTDIYNLGATMYWVLTRQTIPTALPKGDSLMGSVEDRFIEKATHVCELNPLVPQRLGDLVMECIEVDPEQRPESMYAVVDRLNLILGIIRAEAELRERNGSSPAA
jgi:eukaryotic-like serine/threonine-protein kinase